MAKVLCRQKTQSKYFSGTAHVHAYILHVSHAPAQKLRVRRLALRTTVLISLTHFDCVKDVQDSEAGVHFIGT